ncbi:MAG: HD domain-containing protein [Flavobacteriales bacterium]|nr:HD domain-containing protein [Flavobacteriales bacterium]
MSALEQFISGNELLRLSEQRAVALIEQNHSPEYTYHDLAHTYSVASYAFALGKQENVSSVELVHLVIAALFHDTGYFESTNEHEQIGAEYAAQFLQKQDVSERDVEVICEMILKTKVTTTPETLLQKILCDADLSYLGNEAFFSLVERLRLEWQLTGRKNFTEIDWIRQNIDFFEQHQYYTSSAQHHFDHVKQAHRNQMESDLRALNGSNNS